MDRFKTIPLLDDDARFWRVSFDCGSLASGGEEFATSPFDRRLGLGDVVLRIGCLIQDIDFNDLVDWRLRLSMKSLDRDRCACRKSNPGILMMQSSEDWIRKNTPYPLNGA